LIAASESDALGKMRVAELLESLPGYGKIRAQGLMEKFAISPTRRVQGLGRHQRNALLKEFEIPATSTRGRLLVLSGPGGVGKSTVAKALRGTTGFWVSISATTRAPRFNEVHGVDYFFYSNEEFDLAIENNEFLEWAEFAGNRYGTPRLAVEEHLIAGTNVLLEIEISGARQVRSHSEEARLIFLEPPSWEELVSRLEGRGTDSPERRAARLALAQEELAAASFFDSVIVNTEVNEVVEALIRLATS
jgi:guanylate kinase